MNLFPVPSDDSCLAIPYGQWLRWDGAVSRTVRYLQLAASEFDAFITVDKSLQYQQNLSGLPIAVVVLQCSFKRTSGPDTAPAQA